MSTRTCMALKYKFVPLVFFCSSLSTFFPQQVFIICFVVRSYNFINHTLTKKAAITTKKEYDFEQNYANAAKTNET